jgi:hypothetical protein
MLGIYTRFDQSTVTLVVLCLSGRSRLASTPDPIRRSHSTRCIARASQTDSAKALNTWVRGQGQRGIRQDTSGVESVKARRWHDLREEAVQWWFKRTGLSAFPVSTTVQGVR